MPLHVSERMTNNNSVQCLAVVSGLAHAAGILVQTCGCSLGESMSHGFSGPVGVRRDVREREKALCARAEVDLVVLISLGTFLYVTTHTQSWKPGHCAIYAGPDSAYVTCNDYKLKKKRIKEKDA